MGWLPKMWVHRARPAYAEALAVAMSARAAG